MKAKIQRLSSKVKVKRRVKVKVKRRIKVKCQGQSESKA